MLISPVLSTAMTILNLELTSSMDQGDRPSTLLGPTRDGPIRKNRLRHKANRKINKIFKDLPLQVHLPHSTKSKDKLEKSMKPCNDILKEMFHKKHESIAWPFYEPVDPVQLGLSDYFNIVKRPMDLSTVRSKIQNNDYNSQLEFAADVRLIFTNCYKYSDCESDVVKQAQALQQVFETLYAKIEWVLPTSSDSSDSGSCSIDERISQFQYNLAVMKDQLQELIEETRRSKHRKKLSKSRQGSPVLHSTSAKTKPVLVIPNTLEIPPANSMSYEETVKLSEDLSNIKELDKLMDIFHIVQAKEPDMVNDCSPFEYEVPLGELKSSTLWELKAYSDAYKFQMADLNQQTETSNLDSSSDSDSDSSISVSSDSDSNSSYIDLLTF